MSWEKERHVHFLAQFSKLLFHSVYKIFQYLKRKYVCTCPACVCSYAHVVGCVSECEGLIESQWVSECVCTSAFESYLPGRSGNQASHTPRTCLFARPEVACLGARTRSDAHCVNQTQHKKQGKNTRLKNQTNKAKPIWNNKWAHKTIVCTKRVNVYTTLKKSFCFLSVMSSI